MNLIWPLICGHEVHRLKLIGQLISGNRIGVELKVYTFIKLLERENSTLYFVNPEMDFHHPRGRRREGTNKWLRVTSTNQKGGGGCWEKCTNSSNYFFLFI